VGKVGIREEKGWGCAPGGRGPVSQVWGLRGKCVKGTMRGESEPGVFWGEVICGLASSEDSRQEIKDRPALSINVWGSRRQRRVA